MATLVFIAGYFLDSFLNPVFWINCHSKHYQFACSEQDLVAVFFSKFERSYETKYYIFQHLNRISIDWL